MVMALAIKAEIIILWLIKKKLMTNWLSNISYIDEYNIFVFEGGSVQTEYFF